MPDTAFRNRVNDAAAQWTAVAGVNFNYVLGSGGDVSNFSYTNCNQGPNGTSTIHYENIGGANTYAATMRCLKPNGNMREFRIALNSTLNWNNQTAVPAPNEVDTHHVAAHEFGHGTGGWTSDSQNGHFNNNKMCPTDDPGVYTAWQTMCDAVDNLAPPDDEYGKYFRRFLEDHDKHTFVDAYN